MHRQTFTFAQPYLRLALAAVAICFAGIAAHADTYNYSFTGTNSLAGYDFSVDSPELIQGETTLRTSACSFGPPCTIDIFASLGFYSFEGSQRNIGGFTSDLPASFFTVGTHVGSDEIVTITDISAVSSVIPEPSTFALLGTGLLGVAGVVRKRLAT